MNNKLSTSYISSTAILSVCFLGIVAVYLNWLWSIKGGLLPLVSDEFFYFVNSKNYYENTTLRAALTYTGKGSYLFGADGHGFAYPLFNGSISKLFGFHCLNIPLTNLALVLSTIVLVFFQESFAREQKLALCLSLLLYSVVPLYLFSFMQESLHLFFALLCSLLLYKIYDTENKKYIFTFLLLLFFASIFRNLWLFWSIGLLPLAKSRKQFLLYMALFLLCVAISFSLTKLLWDSYPSYFTSVIQLISQGEMFKAASSLVNHFSANVRSFFYFRGDITLYLGYAFYALKILPVFSMVALFVLYYLRNEKVYLAAALICLTNLGLLFVAYIMGEGREIRTMSPLFYMFAFIVVAKNARFLTFIILLYLVFLFPLTFTVTTDRIAERKLQAKIYEENVSAKAAYDLIAVESSSKTDPLILLGYSPYDETLDLLLLPVKSTSGRPIRYAVNYYEDKIYLQDYDYVLFNKAVLNNAPHQFYKSISNGFYSLYKILKDDRRKSRYTN